jgi:hypothetical protein
VQDYDRGPVVAAGVGAPTSGATSSSR